MILDKLKLNFFRNYPDAEIDFREGTNVLYGKNGQGKTNILESIYYLALTKSFRTNRDQNLIQLNRDYFRIQGEFRGANGRRNISAIAYSPVEGKRLTDNGERVYKFSEYIGKFPVVLLAPTDLSISQQGPYQRRQFLDIMLSQASRLYLHHLIEYKRCLRQRNKLLQTEQPDMNQLRSWEEALAKNAAVLINKRMEVVEVMSAKVSALYQKLSSSEDKTKIIYQSSLPLKDLDALDKIFLQEIEKNRLRDVQLGSTTIGPHRDDLLFLINGKPLRTIGSQGEHKTLVIALKMAEFEYLDQLHEGTPLLLFDDLFGELDGNRIGNLVNSLSAIGQVFITTTSADFFGKLKQWDSGTTFYEVVKGTIRVSEMV